jgi:ATP-binding cassette subfamily C protein CydC
VRLSAGQARRVAIARALLSDAPILLLDEPTESLDPPTERALLADLARLMTGRTVVLVTHNLAVLHALVDEVLVLEAGRITARGSHSRLLEAGGYYARCHDLLAEPAAAE